MSSSFDPSGSASSKKRYRTPLHVEELLRSEQKREQQLVDRMKHSESKPESEPEPEPEPEQRDNSTESDETDYIVSSNGRSSGETPPTSHSSGSQAAAQNDAWLPYERFSTARDKSYFDFEFEEDGSKPRPATARVEPTKNTPTRKSNRRIISIKADGPPPVSQSVPVPSLISQPTPENPKARREPGRRVLLPLDEEMSKIRTSQSQDRRSPRGHPRLENGQLYHSQLNQRRAGPVPNYSRRWTPASLHDQKRAQSSRPHKIPVEDGDRTIAYEQVNGICLDTRPRSPMANQKGMAIPEVEARDVRDIAPKPPGHRSTTPPQFDGIISRPARSPPPVGAREDFVSKISAQPSNPGSDHVFTSGYTYQADDSASDPSRKSSDGSTYSDDSEWAAALPPAIARSRAPIEEDTDTSGRTVERGRTLLTGVFKGLFKPLKDSPRLNVYRDRSRHADKSQQPRSQSMRRLQTHGIGRNRNTYDFSVYEIDLDDYDESRGSQGSFHGKYVTKIGAF